MGESDLNFVSGRVKPITVGIFGPESAGKTTILGSFYLLLGRGALTTEENVFSNSYTLTGWEAVAASMRWRPGPQPPRFPPHTPSGTARAPGMLHLAFRRKDGSLRDLLFADAPGEWFRKWAVNQEALDAEGARWIARHADVTLLIADRQALSGSKMAVDAPSILQRFSKQRLRTLPTIQLWQRSRRHKTPGAPPHTTKNTWTYTRSTPRPLMSGRAINMASLPGWIARTLSIPATRLWP